MKKILFLIVALIACSTLPASAKTSRTDKDGNEVYYPIVVTAQYQMGDFDLAKESSWYGLGLYCTSISHWGRFHVGADLDMNIDAGIVDNWGMLIDFGPSFRVDISRNFFLNVPINAFCSVFWPKGGDSQSTWGGKIAPSIHGFFNDHIGLFAGPNVSFGKGVSFGMQAGISVCF
ncbi:MAG: hypothetical protein ACI304_06385 [Lepagella sp.]